MADPALIVGGGALLFYLLGGKKKRSSSSTGGTGTGTGTGGADSGASLDRPEGTKQSGKGSGGGSKSGGGRPSNLAPDAIWVSKDCKEVVFGDETGEAWWARRGASVAAEFIKANYRDPYEIARAMVLSMAPCVMEFPVAEDDLDPMYEEFSREMFLRKFPGPYYLLQFIYDRVAEMLGQEKYTLEFGDDCDVVFVGDNWMNPVARRMAMFYRSYMYPNTEWVENHKEKYKAWEGADPDQKYMLWWTNIATAILNRMHPTCGKDLAEAFRQQPLSASTYFAQRPGLEALYGQILDMVNEVDDELTLAGEGLDFNLYTES